MLYYTILYYTILYYTILYYTIPHVPEPPLLSASHRPLRSSEPETPGCVFPHTVHNQFRIMQYLLNVIRNTRFDWTLETQFRQMQGVLSFRGWGRGFLFHRR